MTLQELMLQYRAKNGLSQERLARLCNVSTQTINSVENGLQRPSKLTEEKIRLVVKEEDK